MSGSVKTTQYNHFIVPTLNIVSDIEKFKDKQYHDQALCVYAAAEDGDGETDVIAILRLRSLPRICFGRWV